MELFYRTIRMSAGILVFMLGWLYICAGGSFTFTGVAVAFILFALLFMDKG